MRRIFLSATLAASLAIASGLAWADSAADLATCPGEGAPELVEPACTRVLEGARLDLAERVGAHLYRASARRRLGDPARALADIDAALAIAPTSLGFHRERAALLQALGRLEEARAAEARAHELRLGPTDAEFLLIMALGLLLSIPKALGGLLAGLLILRAVLGAAVAFAIGVGESLVPMIGGALEAGAVSLIGPAIGGAVGVVWWAFGRVLRRITMPRPPSAAAA